MMCGQTSRARIGAFALATIIAPAAAQAQISASPSRTFDTPERAITIAVSNDLLYDTNVARGSDDAAILRRIKKEDVRVSPSVTADIILPRGRVLFTLRGTIGQDLYARNTRLNRERVDVATGATLPLALCTIAPEGSFTRRQIDLFDLAIEPLAPAASANAQTVRRARAAVHCGPEVGFRAGGFMEYADTTNSNPLRRPLNVQFLGYGSEIAFASPTVGVVAVFVRQNDFTYDNRPIAGSSDPARFRVTAGGLRIDRRLGARLQLVGSLSYADVAMPRALRGDRELDGLNWSLAATLRLGDRLLLAADSERAIEGSPGFLANFVRRTSSGGSLTYAFSPLVHLGASLSRRERKFQLAPTQPVPAITADTIDEARLWLDYQRQPIRLRLSAAYQQRDADRDLYDYRATLVTLSASYVFKR
ncbi:hypothetical protein [Sphingomonas jeddahensis]|uniref:Porin n=1 Tax=Sphingomonas jeddahensis TaxID=1915074 RepID=A0A1V2EQS0_9SPHN|nr:hypothetical protein [Sphingomonas jeddahensis]ONF95022.1 hypothetical protein SPHI_28020 [Sphingomonas jeddahensis]